MKKIVILISVLLFAFTLFAGQQTWIPLNGDAEKAVEAEVLTSNDNLIEIEYAVNGFYKEEVLIDGKAYSKIILLHEGIFS